MENLKEVMVAIKSKTVLNICLEKINKISFDPKTNCETFKSFFENLVQELVKKLPSPTNVFGTDSIDNYYKNLDIQKQAFSLKPTTQCFSRKM